MIIACPRCSSRYEVAAGLFGTAPRTVKCTACEWQWVESPRGTSDESTLPPANEDIADESPPAGGKGPTTLSEAALDMIGTLRSLREGASAVAPLPPLADQKALPPQAVDEGPNRRPAKNDAAAAGSDDFEVELATEIEPPATDGSSDPLPPPAPRRAPRWLIAAMAAAAAIVIVLAGLLLARQTLVEAVPGSASVFRLFGLSVEAKRPGLEIREVASSREWSGTDEVLVVTGVIANTGDGAIAVPTLRVALYDTADQELQSVTVPGAGKMLLMNETTRFQSRILGAMETAQRIKITFDERQD